MINGGLPGGGVVDRPGQERLSDDDARDPGIPQAADPVEVADPAGDEDLDVDRGPQGRERHELGLAPAVAQDEPRDAEADELTGELRERRGAAAPPRECRETLGAGIEADRQPVAGDGEAGSQRVGIVGECEANHDPRRAGGEREPDAICGIDPACDLDRGGDARRDLPDGLEVARAAGAGPVEVDQVDERRPEADEVLGDPVGTVGRRSHAARDAGPEDDPGATAFKIDRWNDLHRDGVRDARRCRRSTRGCCVRLPPRRERPP